MDGIANRLCLWKNYYLCPSTTNAPEILWEKKPVDPAKRKYVVFFSHRKLQVLYESHENFIQYRVYVIFT